MARRHHGIFGECDICNQEKDLDYCKLCGESYCGDCQDQHEAVHIDFGDDDED